MLFPKPEPKPKRNPRPGHPYLEWVRHQPCAACGERRSEAAHVRGPMSLKTHLPLPRRKDEAYLCALPLCPRCHRTGKRSVHEVGEDRFAIRTFGRPDALTLIAFTYLSRWAMTRATV